MTTRTERVAQYRAHLRSDLWQAIRERVLDRADGRCEFCGAPATQVHHVRYPKQFKDDDEHNSVAVCNSCHARAHAMRYPRKECSERTMQIERAAFTVRWFTHPNKYGIEEQWVEKDQMKRALALGGAGSIDRAADRAMDFKERHLVEGDHLLKFEVQDANGWRVVEFINHFGVTLLASAFPASKAHDAAMQWLVKLYDEHSRLKAQQQAPALPAPTGGDWAQTMLTVLTRVAEQNSGLIAQHNGLIGEHGQQLQRIEQALPVLHDGAQMISVKAGFAERMRVPSTVMSAAGYDGMTAAAYVGEYLTITGAETGPKIIERLDGCSVKTEIKTYRRDDVHRAIDVAFGINPPHLREVRRMYRDGVHNAPAVQQW